MMAGGAGAKAEARAAGFSRTQQTGNGGEAGAGETAREPGRRREDAVSGIWRVGLAQVGIEKTLGENTAKIVDFVARAASERCTTVVLPEGALDWEPGTSRPAIDDAIETIRQAAARHQIHVIAGAMYKRFEGDPPFNILVAFAPDGSLLQRYHKVWRDERAVELPRPFEIEGVRCATSICADRWARAVEELPAMDGAQVLIECSNNFANEWLPELEWFWYVPRALRNGCYVLFANTADKGELPGHGHSAVIAPDGSLVAALGGEVDQLLVCDLDPARATLQSARQRREHPLFRDFWEIGVRMLSGERRPPVAVRSLPSAEVAITVAAAQMDVRNSVEANLARMTELVEAAKNRGADLVVFPELALTGRHPGASSGELSAAVARMQAAARQARICVVFGMPSLTRTGRRNSGVVLGSDGTLLTRYDGLVVDDRGPFEPGTSAAAMWFEVRGVPAVVTVGGDVLWNEIAELAAIAGAQIHCHLANDAGERGRAADRLLRDQLWVNLGYRTITVTANAARPLSGQGGGGSAIWSDLGRFSRGRGKGPYSAVPVARAGEAEELIVATLSVPRSNAHPELITAMVDRRMEGWLQAGARAVRSQAPAGAAAIPTGS
jgi:predicted amidohydrolase